MISIDDGAPDEAGVPNEATRPQDVYINIGDDRIKRDGLANKESFMSLGGSPSNISKNSKTSTSSLGSGTTVGDQATMPLVQKKTMRHAVTFLGEDMPWDCHPAEAMLRKLNTQVSQSPQNDHRSPKQRAEMAHNGTTRRVQKRAKNFGKRHTMKSMAEQSTTPEKMAMINEKFRLRSTRQLFSWKTGILFSLMFFQLLGAVISIVLLLPNKPASGDWTDFGPRQTMKVGDVANAIFLGISRVTAYMMYPCVILVFIAKAHCLRTAMWSTQLRLYLPYFERMHDVHVRAGWFCLLLTWLHSVFHIVRWARLGHLKYLYTTQTGATGLIGWICCTLVCLPMGLKKLRMTIRYEIRHFLHTVGGVGFGLCGAFHAPATNVMYIYLSVTLIYMVDWFYANFFKTYEVEFCHFTRLQKSTVLHWQNPPGYNNHQHGYVNICIPFIRKYEWHAISIYPHATEANCSSLCIARAGDWSNKLHDDTTWKTMRPVWIQGPFLTPFSASVDYDNAICVSSGSGISASLAALQSLKNHRRVSLIWLCRDASMVEFYLEHTSFDNDAYTLIYYTGKQKLKMDRRLPPMVFIFECRPDLRSTVCMIIKSIESEDCLPEEMVKESEQVEMICNQAANDLKFDAINALDDPIEILNRLFGRALKNFSYGEMLDKCEGQRAGDSSQHSLDQNLDAVDVGEFEQILLHILPEAYFPPHTLECLAGYFADSETEKISREKFINHCKNTLNKYMGSGGVKTMSAEQSVALGLGNLMDKSWHDMRTQHDLSLAIRENSKDKAFSPVNLAQMAATKLSTMAKMRQTPSGHTVDGANSSDAVKTAREEVIEAINNAKAEQEENIVKARGILNKHGGSQDLRKYIANLDDIQADGRLGRWAVMYCGGSVNVSTELRQVCRDFDIKYDEEKFDW
jgi:hypothetical protein